MDLNNPREQVTTAITDWLKGIDLSKIVLNVAGSRESKNLGIQHAVMARMIDVISRVNGLAFYPLLDEGLSGWIIKEDSLGNVVRLKSLVEGIEPGYYVLLGRNDDTITLCMLGEDENGEIATTDKIVQFPAHLAAALHPTKMKVKLPPQE